MPSLGLVYISNANPACSCVYICKFQFRPIHPPSRRLSGYKSPDCPVSHPRRTRRSREMKKATWLKFTGLSCEPTAPAANGRPRDQRATRGQLQRSAGCTGLSGVHRTVSGAPTSPEEQRSDVPDMEGDRAPDMKSGCPVVHRTILCTTRQNAGIAF
jgi:hypothetical protein